MYIELESTGTVTFGAADYTDLYSECNAPTCLHTYTTPFKRHTNADLGMTRGLR